MLAACTTPPPVGVNEPPDALDHIRAADLQPRFPQPIGTADTGSAGIKPQLYYGTTGGQAGGAAAGASDGDQDPATGTSTGDGVNLNFEDSPVSAVAKVILGDILGVGYSIDPRVQGTISLSSGRPIPKSQVLYVLESALHTSNAVLVHDAGGYHIVPADDAIGGGHVDRAGAEPGYGISVVPLQHVSVQTITKLLESFATKPGSIRADPTNNLLIVAGNGTERRTAVDTILSFDADWMRGQSVGIFPVHSTQPEPLVAELEKILDSGEDGLSQHLVKLQPISRLNAVLVVARKPELLRAAEKWINRLDGSAVASTGVKVYKVRYGDCVKIAKLLSALFVGGGASTIESPTNQIAPGAGATALSTSAGGQGQTQGPYGGLGGGGLGGGGLGGGGGMGGGGLGGGGLGGGGGGLGGGGLGGGGLGGGGLGGGGGGLGGAGAGTPESRAEGSDTAGFAGGAGGGGGGRALMPGVRILPDVANNSIVIYANAENYHIIERALDQLDRPQLQVAVDMTIAEVTLNDSLSYGVQFFLGSLNTANSFSNGVQVINTPSAAAGAPPGVSPGFNFMIGSKLTPHVIINALHDYTTVKILSNPSLVVVNNQVATLTVGDQIPITTGNANILNSATATSNTVFNSITYQNTGIILRILPRINANGSVSLDIEQEISECANCSTTTPNLTPTINERKVKSSITVAGGQTVLLAGLISETQNGERAGIPVLDQIPLIGEAFTPTNSRNLSRSELIIFIRPQVIRDGVDASVVAEELRSKLRGDKIGIAHPPGAVTPYPLGLVQ
jgi:general secretion pathway protein D